jgi:hypothetical protein
MLLASYKNILIAALCLYTDIREQFIGEFISKSPGTHSSLRIDTHILRYSIFLTYEWNLDMVHYPVSCMSIKMYALRRNWQLLQSLPC